MEKAAHSAVCTGQTNETPGSVNSASWALAALAHRHRCRRGVVRGPTSITSSVSVHPEIGVVISTTLSPSCRAFGSPCAGDWGDPPAHLAGQVVGLVGDALYRSAALPFFAPSDSCCASSAATLFFVEVF
jgi:hypothetical protein